MKTHVNSLGKRVTVYIGETDQWRHQPLYMAILEFLRREGCARATVERGIAGFGANSRIKTTSLLDLSVDLPVIVTWVERPDRVERMDPKNHPGVLEYFMSKLPFGSLSTEARSPLQRARGKTAADLMTREVITLAAETPIGTALALSAEKHIKRFPVVDATGKLVGIVGRSALLSALVGEITEKELQ